MDIKNAIADFQFIANRVSKFSYEIADIDVKDEKAKVNYNIDYNILSINEDENNFVGKLEYITDIRANVNEETFFIIQLIMEGVFIGNKKKLSETDFKNRMELNGIATLSHLSRSYIIAATSLAGMNPPVKTPMANIHLLMAMKKNKEDNKK